MDNYEFQSEPENSFHENYNLYRDKRSQSDLRTACHYFRSVVQRRGNDHGYQR